MQKINYKLQDVCIKITDGSHYSPSNDVNGYPMLSIKDMEYSGFNYDGCKFVNDEEFQKMKKSGCTTEIGDVLLAKDGSFLDRCFVIKDNREQAVLSSIAIIKTNSSILSPNYLKYCLTNPLYKKYLADKFVSGTALKRIILKSIKNFPISLPPIEEQKRVASILSNIDDKIQNNKKINNILEQELKLLYEYWFVQFDFPNKDNKPYKSAGGKMIYNEQLKKEIPEGWKIENLLSNSISSAIKVGVDFFKDSKYYYDTSSVNGTSISIGKLTTYKERKSRANMQPVANSIWFARMQQSVKHIYLNYKSESFINNSILSTGFFGLKANNNSFEFLSSFIEFSNFEKIKDSMCSGSTQKSITNYSIGLIKLIIPAESILFKFSNLTKNIYNQILQNNEENQKLEKYRDWLLPILFN